MKGTCRNYVSYVDRDKVDREAKIDYQKKQNRITEKHDISVEEEDNVSKKINEIIKKHYRED